jgi:hypothetical protein
MPIQVWETLEYGWINIVLISLFTFIFFVYALFKLRKKTIKQYLINFIVGAIMLLMATQIVSFLSPKVNNMYYQYDKNIQVIWLTEQGWEIVEHYSNKKIVHVRGG